VNMVTYKSNPYKGGIDSQVAALTVFDCDGKEVQTPVIKEETAHFEFEIKHTGPVQVNRTCPGKQNTEGARTLYCNTLKFLENLVEFATK